MQTIAPRRACDAASASLAAVAAANTQVLCSPYQSRWYGNDEQRQHAVDAGAGPVVLFIHGFPSLWSCWNRQMEALRSAWQVIAIDTPGAGASHRSGNCADYAVANLAAAIDRAIDELAGGRRVVLVGHDWGSALAFAYAQARPDRLAGVVGMSAPPVNLFLDLLAGDPSQQARSIYMQRLRELDVQAATALAPGLAGRAYAGLVERGVMAKAELDRIATAIEDPAALLAGAGWYRANVPAPGETAMHWPKDDPPLAIPAMLVWGTADQAFVPDVPERFVARHPDANLLRLPGTGHWPMFEATATVNAALAEFLHRPDVLARQKEPAA